MTRVFGGPNGYGYDGGSAPTIWLRNSRRGSPHGSITDVQKAQKSIRDRAGITYEQIRNWAVADLLITDMPHTKIQEYLAVFDAYFIETVMPNIPPGEYQRLLGNWRPQ